MDVGIDLTKISRFADKKDSFIAKVLTEEELEVFRSFPRQERKLAYLASRWAVKEAVFKVTQDSNYLSYSVLNEPSGKPYIKDHPELKVSISDDGDDVIAIVIKE